MNVVVDMEKILVKACSLYQIDPSWGKAIVTAESQWNPYAVRYESSYSYLFEPMEYAKSGLISLSTEIATQKMSWGLGQVMGALAREQGHTGVMAELVDPELNLKHMCIRLAELKNRSNDAEHVFAGYNGGPGAMRKLETGRFSNQKYVDRVLEYLRKG